MGSITPRASGFWANSDSYFPEDASSGDESIEQGQMSDEYVSMLEDDDRTRLDKTIDRIGMGM
jgi:hypothetical protein